MRGTEHDVGRADGIVDRRERSKGEESCSHQTRESDCRSSGGDARALHPREKRTELS